MRFTIYQSSLPGPRPYNQDRLAYSYSKEALLMVVADGMGGHRHGEIAAHLAVSTLTDAFQNLALPTLADPAKFLTDHLQQVHDAIFSLTLANDLQDSPRTTVVAAIVQENILYYQHIGDSRLYHFRNGKRIFRTEDHSVVQLLVNRGAITEAEAEKHPEKHKIYNCLGGDRMPQMEIPPPREMRDGDTLLLCTDGLWSVLEDKDLSKILHAGSITESVPKLLEIANSLCGPHGDNMSAMGMQWGDPNSQDAVSTATMSLDTTTTIINPVTNQTSGISNGQDLSDEEIEKAIMEIQRAINRSGF